MDGLVLPSVGGLFKQVKFFVYISWTATIHISLFWTEQLYIRDGIQLFNHPNITDNVTL